MQSANEWLENAKDILAPEIFGDSALASKCQISYGFPSKGALAANHRTIGQAWQVDGVEAIFISPTIFKQSNYGQILGVLIHEMIHISIGVDKGHRGGFKKMMNKVGLVGKATATDVGLPLLERLNGLKNSIGNPPIALLDSSKAKKQGTRMIRLACDCGRILRLSRKAINEGSVDCGNCHSEFKESV